MAQVGTAFVRIRPALGKDERQALEQLATLSRALADGLDSFLANFAPEPPSLQARPHESPKETA